MHVSPAMHVAAPMRQHIRRHDGEGPCGRQEVGLMTVVVRCIPRALGRMPSHARTIAAPMQDNTVMRHSRVLARRSKHTHMAPQLHAGGAWALWLATATYGSLPLPTTVADAFDQVCHTITTNMVQCTSPPYQLSTKLCAHTSVLHTPHAWRANVGHRPHALDMHHMW